MAPTLVASRTVRPPSPARRSMAPTRNKGFTLIELLVAIAVMALMAGLSWRGIDGMVRTQHQLQQRSDQLMRLQAGLAQWTADLDAMVQLPNTQALDWDGRALRITRRSSTAPGDGLQVVAWTRRTEGASGQWLRWQSAPVSTRADLQVAWTTAARWAQNPGDAEKAAEVRIYALDQWRVFYYRSDAWTNPLSSDVAAPPPSGEKAPGPNLTLPDGVRLVLTLPADGAVSGTLTRDWVRLTQSGGKS